LRNKLFDTAVIIHDSVFINTFIDFSVDKYKIIWSFKHMYDEPLKESSMINIFMDEKLRKFHENKHLWVGCFGCMTVITHDYLTLVDNEYSFSKLLDVIKTRNDRCVFERVLACLLQINADQESLIGDIFEYCPWGITYDNKDKYAYLPITKVWTGR